MSAAEGRKFGLVVGGAFLVIAGILLWREHGIPSGVAAALGTSLVLGGLLVPTKLGPVERAWMKLALLISKVTTPIFMGVIFFVVLTPAGLIARLLGHRPLVHAGASSWIPRAADQRQSNLQRQF
jgi:hypothetical protein